MLCPLGPKQSSLGSEPPSSDLNLLAPATLAQVPTPSLPATLAQMPTPDRPSPMQRSASCRSASCARRSPTGKKLAVEQVLLAHILCAEQDPTPSWRPRVAGQNPALRRGTWHEPEDSFHSAPSAFLPARSRPTLAQSHCAELVLRSVGAMLLSLHRLARDP